MTEREARTAMSYKDFTDYLNDKFYKEYPTTMDDEWIEKYEDWLAEQDPADLVRYADEYALSKEKEVARKCAEIAYKFIHIDVSSTVPINQHPIALEIFTHFGIKE